MEMSDQPGAVEASGGPEKLRLKVASGNAAGTVIEVEDELVIGRQAEGVGSLANDIEISRQHARITRGADGRYLIEDLDSTNGTWVNGRAVEAPTPLETGDRIEVGASALIVQVTAPPPTPRSTPVTTTSAMAESDAPLEVPVEPETGLRSVDPEAGAAGAPEAGLPRLELRIDIDPEAGEITLTFDESGGEVTFVHDGARWRPK